MVAAAMEEQCPEFAGGNGGKAGCTSLDMTHEEVRRLRRRQDHIDSRTGEFIAAVELAHKESSKAFKEAHENHLVIIEIKRILASLESSICKPANDMLAQYHSDRSPPFPSPIPLSSLSPAIELDDEPQSELTKNDIQRPVATSRKLRQTTAELDKASEKLRLASEELDIKTKQIRQEKDSKKKANLYAIGFGLVTMLGGAYEALKMLHVIK